MDAREFQDRLQSDLESGKILPSGTRASVYQADYQLQLPTGAQGADFRVEFFFDQPRYHFTALIQCLLRPTATDVEPALYRLQDRLASISEPRPSRPTVGMIAAPTISPNVQEACKKHKLAYVDLNGNFYVANENLLIDIARKQKFKMSTPFIKNIFSGKSRRVARLFLCNPGIDFRLGTIAKQTELSTAQVFHVCNRLEEFGVLERSRGGKRLVRPNRLLRLFSEELRAAYLQERQIHYGLSETEGQRLNNEIASLCEREHIQFAFTLFSGLEPHERNVVENLTAVYVSTDPRTLAAKLRIPTTSIGANLFLMRPPTVDDTASGGVFYRTRFLKNGLPAVNLVQAYLDFMLYPGRGEEQAFYIQNQLLGFKESDALNS